MLNDLILVRKSISWSYLFPLAVIAISSFGNVSFLLMVMPMAVLFLANSLAVNLFSREEASGWRIALRSFPVTGLEVAASRFLVAAALLAVVSAVMGVLVLVAAFVTDVGFEGACIGLALGVWLLLAAIMVASVFISARILSAEFPARDFLA